jgi:hypothetical protein
MLLSKKQIYEDIMAGKIRIINAWSIKHSIHPDNKTLNLPIYSIVNDLITKQVDEAEIPAGFHFRGLKIATQLEILQDLDVLKIENRRYSRQLDTPAYIRRINFTTLEKRQIIKNHVRKRSSKFVVDACFGDSFLITFGEEDIPVLIFSTMINYALSIQISVVYPELFNDLPPIPPEPVKPYTLRREKRKLTWFRDILSDLRLWS